MKSKVILLPPAYFSSADVYCRKRWRRVRRIPNEFWSRLRKEFLWTLQERKTRKRKWWEVGLSRANKEKTKTNKKKNQKQNVFHFHKNFLRIYNYPTFQELIHKIKFFLWGIITRKSRKKFPKYLIRKFNVFF